MNGKALCLLKRSDFMERVPKYGDLLYNALQNLIQKNTGSIICQQVPPYPNVVQTGTTSVNYSNQFTPHQGTENSKPSGLVFFPSSATASSLTTSSSPPGVIFTSADTQTTTINSTSGVRPFVPILPHPPRPPQQTCKPDVSCINQVTAVQGILSPAPSAGDTESASDDDLDDRSNEDVKMNFVIDLPNNSPNEMSPIFRKQDSGMYCRLLWEFIHQLLQDPHYSSYICWENPKDLVFRIINPTGLAELWGHQKNRTNMTYEKLSRALRYYYRMNIIKKVSGKRLTYKFMQPPNNIQKGQRGAKPHNKTLTLRSSPESVSGPDVVQKSENSPTTFSENCPNDEVRHVMDFTKRICFNGTVIKSEPNDSTSSTQDNTFRNGDSHSPTTTTRSDSSSPKRLKSPVLTLPISISDQNCDNLFPYNLYTMTSIEGGQRLEPKEAHVKTKPYLIPRVPSNQLTDTSNCSVFNEEPQDFTMTTLKRKHQESVEYDNVETKFNKHNEDETEMNSNFSFNMS